MGERGGERYMFGRSAAAAAYDTHTEVKETSGILREFLRAYRKAAVRIGQSGVRLNDKRLVRHSSKPFNDRQ